MTNFEVLKTLNKEELAKWIASIIERLDSTPWDDFFDKKYCSQCSCVHKDKMNLSFCEANNFCKFFKNEDYLDPVFIIKLWLDQETDEEKNN